MLGFTRKRPRTVTLTFEDLARMLDGRSEQLRAKAARLETENRQLAEDARTAVVRLDLAESVRSLCRELCEARIEHRDVRRALAAVVSDAVDDEFPPD